MAKLNRAHSSVLVAVAGLALLSSPATARSKDKFDENAYAALIARAEADPASVDFLELRKQTSARLDYADDTWDDWQKADALVDTDPEKALKMARERASGVWTDFLAHIVAQLALEKLGKPDEAAGEARIVGAIVKSIGGGHKGTGEADAFTAVSVAEEYRTLALLRLKPEKQALVTKGGHSFDIMTVTDLKTNQQRDVWFNIDIFFGKELGL